MSNNVSSHHPAAIPPAIDKLVSHIQTFPSVQKVILYGSRARGDHGAFSDVDIAVTGVHDDHEWSRIHQLADMDGRLVASLLKIDLVQFELADPLLQQSIAREGVVLYERR